ncbi:potassium-transporting ATPase potassium-binding subunit [Reticulibacter mediterranei]|uniref:Potassium-transporting ATPase potassium-binding subunit n=1 Tax=Reticulibacter mediterranei TaxID=2778369 RepID=A0A8J3IH28_9CHLR|nr:potassium-transporting ATPase subunit KdpA [Reticulibacter mediterranei]GHO95414.1 potassium-transporting ATPase potassium-binding subunit [Reticulibacter mediterranei]
MPVTVNSVVQVLVFLLLVLLVTKPLGLYMAKVFTGERTWLSPVLVPVERLLYRWSGVDPEEEQKWSGYVIAMLLFSVAGMLLLYLLERTQQWHGSLFNPQGLGPVEERLAFNTAASFTTNTNWQFYTGEQTMSYLTQMAGLAFHNFVSAATGIALAVALVRGLSRRSAQTLGNFWVDLTRCILYILLPVSIIGALVLVSQGVIQNFNPYTVVHTLDGATQTIAQGPVASQEIIKEMGTNGGGFFNTNSAHPFENPNELTNLIEMLAIISIGAGLFYMFGKMVGDTRQGWALWAVSASIWLVGMAVALPAEQVGNPQLSTYGVNQAVTATQSGGNMEGKEVRYGITNSVLWAVTTTDTSCGAVNSFHDSYTPLGGMIPLTNIALGEIIFGGVGSGLYGMLMFAIIAVFIAGLMVGRTPEYLGKKIERKEVMMAALALLILPASILGFSAVASVLQQGTVSILNPGPHGLSEILYAYTSANGNNGSAFAGLSGSPYYNWTMGFAMLIGRFAFLIPIMAFGGSLVQKRVVPAGLGTFPTTGPLFVGLLIGVILIVGALTYFPAYSLGPIVEHLLMLSGKTF